MTELAVLLCAGRGTRLLPITLDRPKALVEVGGDTLLHRAIEQLGREGVREVVVATGYCREAVEVALAGCPLRVTFCHNEAFDRTQNAVSLCLCAGAVAGRPFFKLDGDVLFQGEVLRRLDASRAPLAVAIETRADLGEEEMKTLGKDLDPLRCRGESIGIERLSAEASGALFEGLLDASRKGRVELYYEDIYSELIGRGLMAEAIDVSDLTWIEIDTPADLARAEQLVVSGRIVRTA
jgi:choline kinase